jgi:hypothetical protein
MGYNSFGSNSLFRPSEVPKIPQNPNRLLSTPTLSTSPLVPTSHSYPSDSLSSSNPPPQHPPWRSRHHRRRCPWTVELAEHYPQQRPAEPAEPAVRFQPWHQRYRQRHPAELAGRFQQRFQQPDQRHQHQGGEKRWGWLRPHQRKSRVEHCRCRLRRLAELAGRCPSELRRRSGLAVRCQRRHPAEHFLRRRLAERYQRRLPAGLAERFLRRHPAEPVDLRQRFRLADQPVGRVERYQQQRCRLRRLWRCLRFQLLHRQRCPWPYQRLQHQRCPWLDQHQQHQRCP